MMKAETKKEPTPKKPKTEKPERVELTERERQKFAVYCGQEAEFSYQLKEQLKDHHAPPDQVQVYNHLNDSWRTVANWLKQGL